MHCLHIVHKDIKPANILWSIKYSQFVLCDFGVSDFVRENAGEKSETNVEGTFGYMGR
jgi:serine/threonine protein kinase